MACTGSSKGDVSERNTAAVFPLSDYQGYAKVLLEGEPSVPLSPSQSLRKEATGIALKLVADRESFGAACLVEDNRVIHPSVIRSRLVFDIRVRAFRGRRRRAHPSSKVRSVSDSGSSA